MAEAPKDRTIGLDQSLFEEPLAGVGSVFFEPGLGGAQAEAIAPGIHVSAETLGAHSGKMVCEENLQVANGAFLRILAARIGVENRSSVRVHTNQMATFMKGGVDRCVRAHEKHPGGRSWTYC